MYNIKFKGKIENFDELERNELPENAVMYKEPKDTKGLVLHATIVSLPIIVISSIVIFSGFDEVIDMPVGYFIFAIAFSTLLLYVHEYIHALAAPKVIEKQVWTNWKEGMLFMYFMEPVTKLRFIWFSFAPNLILGIIPLTLYTFNLFDFNQNVVSCIGLISYMMILGGLGDYLNIFNTIKQVPKGGMVQQYGFNSYWFIEE